MVLRTWTRPCCVLWQYWLSIQVIPDLTSCYEATLLLALAPLVQPLSARSILFHLFTWKYFRHQYLFSCILAPVAFLSLWFKSMYCVVSLFPYHFDFFHEALYSVIFSFWEFQRAWDFLTFGKLFLRFFVFFVSFFLSISFTSFQVNYFLIGEWCNGFLCFFSYDSCVFPLLWCFPDNLLSSNLQGIMIEGTGLVV